MIGDGAMTGGVAFEAIHQAGGLGTPIVVVLNDNGMSIAPNVGALSRYFNRVRLNPKLWHAREGVEEKLTTLPGGIGAAFDRLGPQLKESIKSFWAPGLFWEELDWAYMGVIDGHDVRALRVALRAALEAGRPVVVHTATVKGKGFTPAEDGGLEGMEKWHAAKPKSITNRVPTVVAKPTPEKVAAAQAAPPQYTQVFGDALVDEVRRDRRVVGITAAMNSGTGLNILQKAEPEHYFDVGIAEQQAVLFAAGLALEGAKPVCAIYSTFLQRAFDQIVHDVCLQELDVTFAMDRAGLVGDDGPTHHGVFDIAYLRCLPNITLAAPRDEAQLKHLLRTALTQGGPFGLRYPRGEGVGVALPDLRDVRAIPVGRGEVLREGTRVALVGYGSGVGKALEAADLLAEGGLDVTVADARFAKPLDLELMTTLAAEHELLVTVEEGVLAGGFGSAVWEGLNDAAVDGAADPARRPARPLRHARQARAAARRGRLHRPRHRPPRRGRAVRGPRRSAVGGVVRVGCGPGRRARRRPSAGPGAAGGDGERGRARAGRPGRRAGGVSRCDAASRGRGRAGGLGGRPRGAQRGGAAAGAPVRAAALPRDRRVVGVVARRRVVCRRHPDVRPRRADAGQRVGAEGVVGGVPAGARAPLAGADRRRRRGRGVGAVCRGRRAAGDRPGAGRARRRQRGRAAGGRRGAPCAQ